LGKASRQQRQAEARYSATQAAAKHRITRPFSWVASVHPALWIAAMIVALVATGLSSVGWHPARVPISAEFTRTGEVQAVFAKPLIESTSPACGCTDEKPPGGWEGVTLPVGDLEIGLGRKGAKAQYDIFSPDPANWGDHPGHFGLPHQIGVLLAPDSSPPSAKMLESRRFPSNYILGEGFSSVSDWMSFTANSALHVASVGGDQLAAVGPVAGQPVTVGYEGPEGQFSSEWLNVRAPFAVRTQSNSGNGIPLVDVLGEHVIFWAKIATTQPQIAENYDALPPEPWHPHGRFGAVELEGVPYEPKLDEPRLPAHYTAWIMINVLRRDVFSVRVVTRPAKLAVKREENFERWPAVESESAGQSLVLRDHDIASASASLVRGAVWASQHRVVKLTDLALMKNNAEVSSRNPEDVKELNELYKPIGNEWFKFRFPPVPPQSGVNIFGTVRDLKLASARRQLVVGDTPQTPLVAGTPVELHDLAGPGVVGKHMLVPVQVEAAGGRVHVQGSAVVDINGVSVAVAQAWWRRLLPKESPISFALALLAVVFAAIAVQGAVAKKLG
jgi:hypothetical protein